MDTYAVISLAILVTSLVLATAMAIAWASFGRPEHALSWAIAYLLYSVEIMISVLAAVEPSLRRIAEPLEFLLVLISAALVAIGARQRARLPSRTKPFAIAIGAVFIVVEFIRLLPIRADWVSTADGLFTAAMMIVAISAIRPRTHAPRPAEWVVLGALSIFAFYELALVVADLAQEAAPQDHFRHRVFIAIYLCGLTPIFVANGIAAILLIASDLAGRLRVLASDDPLTGVLNRRGFQEAAMRTVGIGRRRRQTVTIALADIDHFKSINDIHGHQKGDEVLLVISRILETSVDREDKIYRWGGEEFLLFLPHSPIARALILAEGIRQAVSEYQTLSVTVSIGVAEHHDGEAIDQLFSRVDKALYVAKNGGRNRVSRLPFENVELLHSRGGAA